jgi:hypothetical protein
VKRAAVAIALSAALIGTGAAPAQAASTVRRTEAFRIGSTWTEYSSTTWRFRTQSHGRGRAGGNYDRAEMCLTDGSRLSGKRPWAANFRIYAYDSHGRMVASRAGNGAMFGHNARWHGPWCRGLTLHRSRGAVRFMFRVNVLRDRHGERARYLSVRPLP